MNNDIQKIKEELEKEESKPRIEFTSYEKDQEETAIISYEELLRNSQKNKNIDTLVNSSSERKKIDDFVEDVSKYKTPSIAKNYYNEELFLNKLKSLKNNLNA